MCQAFYVNDYARWSMNSHFSKYSMFLSEAKSIEPFLSIFAIKWVLMYLSRSTPWAKDEEEE